MAMHCNFKKLMCVQFPGVVNDHNKAVQCLGGVSAISKAFESSKGCIELNFRPKDPYCKPALSSINETTGLLLRVKVKKKKSANGNITKCSVVSQQILGITHEVHFFQTLTDYQYLPIAPVTESNVNDGLKCILNDIIPSSIPDMSWLEESSSFFFVPPIFSRMTSPQVYTYCDAFQNDVVPELKNIISKFRKSRSNYAYYLNFSHTDPIPTAPKKQAQELVKEDNEYLKILKQIFEEKPIRGRIELKCVTKLPSTELKVILSTVAYNYVNGPWRGLWIKLGYDPRKDPQSRIWQCIDYRVKALSKIINKGKKINYSFTPIKDSRNSRKSLLVDTESDSSDISRDERLYMFKLNVLPIKTQSFYQFCHIYVPEIQEMFSRLGEVLPGALCHEKRGWLPSGFHEQCRLIMSKHTLLLLKQKYGTKEEQPGTSTENKSQEDELQADDISLDDVYNYDEDVGTMLDDEDFEDDGVFQDSDVDDNCDI